MRILLLDVFTALKEFQELLNFLLDLELERTLSL